MRNLLLPLLLSFLGACLESPTSPGGQDTLSSSCQDAALELEQCLEQTGDSESSPSRCEASVAAVEQRCPSGKADGFGDWLCDLGILRHCETPSCEATPLASADSCADYIDAEGCASCDYYTCMEANRVPAGCGADGYFLAYGHRYCERLTLVTRPRLSDAGQRWVDSTRSCLMHALEDQRGAPDQAGTCAEVSRFAFDSHPGCYVQSGFCSLPLSDWWAVLMTVDPGDLELRQVLSTGVRCIGGSLGF